MAPSQRYEALSTYSRDSLGDDEKSAEFEETLAQRPLQSKLRRLLTSPVFCLLTCLAIESSALLHTIMTNRGTCRSSIYSPAADAVKYERYVFPKAFDDPAERTEFMGDPSPELDAKWKESYDHISRIPSSEAAKLVQPSPEIPNDPGYHPILLDLFHGMHCLNEIRKSLHPEYYESYAIGMNASEADAALHLDHCIEHGMYHDNKSTLASGY